MINIIRTLKISSLKDFITYKLNRNASLNLRYLNDNLYEKRYFKSRSFLLLLGLYILLGLPFATWKIVTPYF